MDQKWIKNESKMRTVSTPIVFFVFNYTYIMFISPSVSYKHYYFSNTESVRFTGKFLEFRYQQG